MTLALVPKDMRREAMPAGSDNLANYKSNLSTHKKGIFRKKVSIATMLSWSKVCWYLDLYHRHVCVSLSNIYPSFY